MYDIIGAFHTQRGGEICEPHGVEVYRCGQDYDPNDCAAVIFGAALVLRATIDRWGVTLYVDKNVERVEHTSAKHGTGNSGGGGVPLR